MDKLRAIESDRRGFLQMKELQIESSLDFFLYFSAVVQVGEHNTVWELFVSDHFVLHLDNLKLNWEHPASLYWSKCWLRQKSVEYIYFSVPM